METSRWTDEKLGELNSEYPDSWRPNAARALSRIVDRQEYPGSKKSRWIWASATVLAGGLGSLAFPAPRGAAQRALAPCVGACESFFAGKAPKARSAMNPPVPGLGDLAPDFTLKGADGAFIRLSDYRNKVVLLNFWATWCPPCRAEIPWFVEFERNFGARGFAVIGVSMDEDGWKAVGPFREAHKIRYALGIGDDALARLFGGVDSLPQTLLIGPDGKIAAKYTGIVSRNDYQTAIEKLLPK